MAWDWAAVSGWWKAAACVSPLSLGNGLAWAWSPGGKYRKVESNYLKVIFVRCRLTHRPPVQLDFLLRWAPEWLLQGSALGRQASNRSVDVIAEVGGAETAVNAGVAGLGDVPHVAALRQLEGIPEVPEEDGDGEALAELSYFDKVC